MPPPDGWRSGPRQKAAAHQTNESSVTAVVLDCHVVVLLNPQGRWLRRCYLSLHAATRAHQRALDAGHTARLVLCRLTPVDGGL